MQKILSIHRVLASILGLLIIVLMFIIVVDTGGRFLFDQPLSGAVEISRVVLAWILFLPLAYALVQGTHIQVTMLLMRLRHWFRLVAEVIIVVLSLLYFGLAVYAGWGQFWESFRVGEDMGAPIWIPFWIAKAAVPIGCLLIAAQLGIGLVVRVRQLSKRG